MRSSTNTQSEMLAATMELLNDELDNAKEIFSLTQPEFYDRYKRARVIVDR